MDPEKVLLSPNGVAGHRGLPTRAALGCSVPNLRTLMNIATFTSVIWVPTRRLRTIAKRIGSIFCWSKEHHVGLGVAIVERWVDSHSRTYDVTCYYDAGDWIDIFYVFDTPTTFDCPQRSHTLLLPHGYLDLHLQEVTAPIASFYWTARHPIHLVTTF